MFPFSIRLVLSAFLMWGVCCPASSADSLTILHVNDFHGRVLPYRDKTIDGSHEVGGASYLAEMIKNERKKNPEGTILLSAGDMFQGTPISNLYHGQPVLEFMNMTGFDAMTVGNHELDWGRGVFGDMMSHAHFPVLCANIQDGRGRRLQGIEPYIIVERKGYKVAVIGLTTPSIVYVVNSKYLKDLNVLQPEVMTQGLVNEVRGKGSDVVILLTHLGFDADKQLAATLDGVDVIVGGHSHTAVTEGVVQGRTLVTQAGYNGIYLGIVTLVLERKGGIVKVVEKEGRLKTVWAGPKVPRDDAVARMAGVYNDKIKTKFQQVVGETVVDLVRQGDGGPGMGNLITDAMREATGAQVAFYNQGGIRSDIPRGKITLEQVFTVLPFDDTIVTMELTGSDLLALFEGSSGVGRGMLQVSGVRLLYDLSMPVGNRVVGAEVNGSPLDGSKTYRAAVNDFLAAGGDRFSGFSRGKNVGHGGEVRDAFLGYVKRHSPIRSHSEDRIVIRGR